MAKIRLTPEKDLLIGLITSDEFIKQIEPVLQVQYLQASSSRNIATWCLEYYTEYGCAPKAFIQDIYNQHKKQLREEDAEIIARVLSHVSKKHESKDSYNVPYKIDKAILYIRERRVVMLQENLEQSLSNGRIDKAENLIMSYNTISRVEHIDTNLWTNKQVVHNIFNQDHSNVFRMPGVLGQLIGWFSRGNLYAFAGVAKRGKTRWLAQTANFAAMMGHNTLLIELEMSREEVSGILLNHMLRKPAIDKTMRIGYFGENNEILHKDVELKARTEQDFNKWQDIGQTMCAPLRIIEGSLNNTTLDEINDKIMALEYYDGFVPDVILIDYADAIKGEGHDQRDKINNIWLGLKTMADKHHVPVITATHLNAEALRKDGDAFNVSEDRRKLNHVSGMYILNQTEQEKKDGIMRVKATGTRFGEYTALDEVVVLYSFGAGRTYINSEWMKNIPEYEEDV